jgi:hypothetical protein
MHVETRCKSNYRAIVITPTQAFNILKSLKNNLHHTLVLTCAATALRSSEILALRWADILWLEERIRVSKRWANGKDGETKTGSIGRLRSFASCPSESSPAVALPDAPQEGHGFCFSVLQGARFSVLFHICF